MEENIGSYNSRIKFLFDLTSKIREAKRNKIQGIDLYLQSKLQKIILKTTENYEKMKFRSAVQAGLFDLINNLKWYVERSGGIENCNKEILLETLSVIIRFLAPITPHICEELWEKLGNKGFVSLAKWPEPNEKLINEEAEYLEDLIKNLIQDINEVKGLVKKEPKEIKIYVSVKWKYDLFKEIKKLKGEKDLIQKIMKNPEFKKYGKDIVPIVQRFIKNPGKIPEIILNQEKEFNALNEAKDFLEREFKCKFIIRKAEESKSEKAQRAEPGKPGIEII